MAGVEPAALALGVLCSIRLSYIGETWRGLKYTTPNGVQYWITE